MRTIFIIWALLGSSQIVMAQKQQDKTAEFKESIERGAVIYEDFCSSCHLSDGKGVSKVFPPLDSSDYLRNEREMSIKAIKFGQKGEIIVNGETYNSVMAPLGLSDEEVADVMNYITNSWTNTNSKIITTQEVSKIEQ